MPCQVRPLLETMPSEIALQILHTVASQEAKFTNQEVKTTFAYNHQTPTSVILSQRHKSNLSILWALHLRRIRYVAFHQTNPQRLSYPVSRQLYATLGSFRTEQTRRLFPRWGELESSLCSILETLALQSLQNRHNVDLWSVYWRNTWGCYECSGPAFPVNF